MLARKRREQKNDGIVVNKTELLDALLWLNYGLAKKEIGNQTTGFVFMDDRIHIYNDEIYMSVPFDVSFPVDFYVNGDDLLTVIKGFFEDQLLFNFSDSKVVKITAKKAKAKLAYSKEIVVKDQINDLSLNINWAKIPKDVVEGIDLCGFSAYNDLTKGNLFCVGVLS